MGVEEDLQAMINQTVELAISQKDAYFKEIEASNDILKIKDPKEFVFFYRYSVSCRNIHSDSHLLL